MSSCITTAFETYLQTCITNQVPVVLDQIILAYIPGLDASATPPRSEGMPGNDVIVYSADVDQAGRMDDNAVAYSIVLDTHVGDFTFNAMYLVNQTEGTVAMVVYKEDETKIATSGATQGNSVVKTMVMQYSGAALATGITVEASTWQLDYSGQINGIQANLASLQQAFDDHGHPISEIEGLQDALDGKSATGHGHAIGDVSGLQTALDGKAASSHGHEIADVNGLQAALNGKAASTHNHSISQVTGLQTALDDKAADNHAHGIGWQQTLLWTGDLDDGDFVLSQPYTNFDMLIFIGSRDDEAAWTPWQVWTAVLNIMQGTGQNYQVINISTNGTGYGWFGRFDSDKKTFLTSGQNTKMKAVYGIKLTAAAA